MVMDPMNHEELAAAVAVQASSLHRQYRKFVELDDIKQELWAVVGKFRDTFIDFLDRDPEDMDAVRKGWAAVYTTLWRHGDRYCRKEKAAKSGYRTQDEAFYDRQRIAALVEMRANGTSPTNQYDDTRPKGKTKPGSGYMLETEYADIDVAMKALTPLERGLLLAFFADEMTEQEIAKAWGKSRQSISRYIDQACKKLIKRLGGPSPWQAS